MSAELAARLDRAIQKLCKWRALYAGWWFGTRPNSDPRAQAARDNFDRTIMLRCDVNALTALLIRKGVFTGLVFSDLHRCAETMRGVSPVGALTRGTPAGDRKEDENKQEFMAAEERLIRAVRDEALRATAAGGPAPSEEARK